MGILAEDVARVRDATDIVGLISNTVALRKSGRRWQGLCPFHSEKTPSFSVNAEEGLYYCFGCRASGDAITFVRQTEGLDFAAGVEMLAARAGITLRYDNRGEAAQSGRRRKLAELVAAAVEWYHERLLEHPRAGAARGYLRSRGLTGEEVRRFKVGWAPTEWDALCAALRSRASAEDLIGAGLAVVSSRGGLIDNFRGRVLFPVFDVRGDPVGFGGRILPGADERAGPKYKNSPESPLYAKSSLLYGLNWAKDAIVRARDGESEVIVCEGYTDVIGLHAAGLPQAVATCGTALTEDHVKTLGRFTQRIVLAFDADAAGSAAAERIHRWQTIHGSDVFVANLPPGADPDDLARSDPESLRSHVRDAPLFLEYLIDRALGRANPTLAEERLRLNDRTWEVAWAELLRPLSPEQRERSALAAMEVVNEHPSSQVRDEYLMKVADACHQSPDRLRKTVAESRANSRGVPEPSTRPVDPGIEEQILLLCVHAPEMLPAWITAGLFTSDLHGRIFGLLSDGTPLVQLAEVAEGEAATALARLSVREAPEHAEHVIGRFVFDAAGRWVDAVRRAARTSGDAALGHRLREVKLACDELRAGNWSPAVAERLAGLLDDPTAPFGQLDEVAPATDEAAPATEEERFYDDIPDLEPEPEYADLPSSGEIRR